MWGKKFTLDDVYAKVSRAELDAMMDRFNQMDGGKSGTWDALPDRYKINVAGEMFADRFREPKKPKEPKAPSKPIVTKGRVKALAGAVAAAAGIAGALALLHKYGAVDNNNASAQLTAAIAGNRDRVKQAMTGRGVSAADVLAVKKRAAKLPAEAKKKLTNLGKFILRKRGTVGKISMAAANAVVWGLIAKSVMDPGWLGEKMFQLRTAVENGGTSTRKLLKTAAEQAGKIVGTSGQKIERIEHYLDHERRKPAASYNGFEVDQIERARMMPDFDDLEWDDTSITAQYGDGVADVFRSIKKKLNKGVVKKAAKIIGVSVAVLLAAGLIYQLSTGKITRQQAAAQMEDIQRRWGPSVAKAVAGVKSVPKEALQVAAVAYGASKEAAKKAQQKASDFVAEAADEMPSGPGKDSLLSVADLIEPRKPPLGARARAVGRNVRSQARRAHANISNIFDEVASV
mgnify:CR=1 FL=1